MVPVETLARPAVTSSFYKPGGRLATGESREELTRPQLVRAVLYTIARRAGGRRRDQLILFQPGELLLLAPTEASSIIGNLHLGGVANHHLFTANVYTTLGP